VNILSNKKISGIHFIQTFLFQRLLACEAIAYGYVECAENSGSSATVPLHARHPGLGFDGEAASVVHNTLTHPGHCTLHKDKKMAGMILYSVVFLWLHWIPDIRLNKKITSRISSVAEPHHFYAAPAPG
jgi:hypothetical protein